MEKLHVAMLPWLAVGHLLPFLELSWRLAHKGCKVSFLSTPKNIKRLPKLPSINNNPINFVELHFPSDVDQLPPAAEATVDLPSDDLRPFLRRAYDSLDSQLSDFLHDCSPDWLLCDYAAYWAPKVAADAGVAFAYVDLFSAATSVFYGPSESLAGGEGTRSTPEEFTVTPPWVPFESDIKYRSYEAEELFAPGVLPDSSGVSEAYRFSVVIDSCKFCIVRSCYEFEPEWIELLEKIYQKPVVPAGFFPPLHREENEEDDNFRVMLQWLDKQALNSVVYAAFGSEVKLNKAQVEEIALGLESSGLPFVWVLRSPEDWLPVGFSSRTEERGLAIFGWAPQIRLLAHPSVGGFLTHGGWSSLIEGFVSGVPMAMLPLLFDQGLNTRHLAGKGFGIEVARDENGSINRHEIAASLRMIMVGEQGEKYRNKARECMNKFGDEELHDGYVTELVKYLSENR